MDADQERRGATVITEGGFPVPGARLAWELSDEGGHPVVQLHGLTSSRARDRTLGLDLGRGLSGTRLLRYDARGHGRSTGRPMPSDYRWPVLADDLLRLLDGIFPSEAVHGVGQSMGAATLLYAAIRDPERFTGLTLMLPPTAWATRARKAEEYRAAGELVRRHGVEAFVTAGLDGPQPPAKPEAPRTVPDVDPALLPYVFEGAGTSDLPSLADIAQVHVPVTVLAWVRDRAHPVSTAQILAETLPTVDLKVAATREEVSAWPEVLCADVARNDEAAV